MTDPDWDVAEVTRDLLRDPNQNGSSAFGDLTGVSTIPDDRVVLSNTEAGRGIDYTKEYVLVSESGERSALWRYHGLTAYDADALATIEIATPDSRARREELWDELFEIAQTYNKSSDGLPGDWGTLELDGAPFNDEAFRWWGYEAVFAFSKDRVPV